ncbi:uncharacterized protein TNCV_2361441 [Trichonephila clavipes]|nr:uncharacterized protein TNCV_2361441 [Trichonephila clavipes]
MFQCTHGILNNVHMEDLKLGQQALLPTTIYHANETAQSSPKSPFPDVSLQHTACLLLLQSTISPSPLPELLIRRWVARSSITHEEVRES